MCGKRDIILSIDGETVDLGSVVLLEREGIVNIAGLNRRQCAQINAAHGLLQHVFFPELVAQAPNGVVEFMPERRADAAEEGTSMSALKSPSLIVGHQGSGVGVIRGLDGIYTPGGESAQYEINLSITPGTLQLGDVLEVGWEWNGIQLRTCEIDQDLENDNVLTFSAPASGVSLYGIHRNARIQSRRALFSVPLSPQDSKLTLP